jgi:nucleoid-associated protein YgaU
MAFDPNELFLASWGDIQLFVSSMEWDGGETQVIHDLAAGDLHPVQPRGSRIRKAVAQLLFDDFAGASETGFAAFRRFQASTKERRIFTHPVDGSFFARIGEFKPTVDENSVVRGSCEFIPDAVVPPVAPSGAGSTAVSGESSVAAASDILAERLSDQGVGFRPEQARRIDFTKPIALSIDLAFSASLDVNVAFSANVSASGSASGSASASASATAAAGASAFAFADVYASAFAVAQATAVAQASGMAGASAFAFAYASAALNADARASVASWNDEDVPLRKIAIDATRLSESVATMIEVGGFERDLQLWPAFRAAILLGDSIRSAIVAASSETPKVFVMLIQRPTALLSLAAKIYGGFDAQARARQIIKLNDIKTPGWLDPGQYLMPERPTQGSSALLEDP